MGHSFEIVIEKVHHGKFSHHKISEASKTVYEESFDGSHAGWFQFRKDVAHHAGFKSQDWILEVKDSSDSWVKVDSGEGLNPFLDAAIENHTMHIRVMEAKELVSKHHKHKHNKHDKSKERDLEMGEVHHDHKKHHKKHHHESGSETHIVRHCCWFIFCFPPRLALLILLYALLFVFWVVGLIFCLIVDLFCLPIKCCCPACCLCECLAEEIVKDAFGLFLYVLKLPIKLAKFLLT